MPGAGRAVAHVLGSGAPRQQRARRLGPAILGRRQLSGYPAKHGPRGRRRQSCEGPWRERKNRSDLTAVGDCGLPEPGRPDDPGPPSERLGDGRIDGWRRGVVSRRIRPGQDRIGFEVPGAYGLALGRGPLRRLGRDGHGRPRAGAPPPAFLMATSGRSGTGLPRTARANPSTGAGRWCRQ